MIPEIRMRKSPGAASMFMCCYAPAAISQTLSDSPRKTVAGALTEHRDPALDTHLHLTA